MSSSAESADSLGPFSPVDRPLAGRLGFERHHRLLTPAQFAAVFSARRVLRGEHFALHYRPNDLATARIGFVIPKKQARFAVLRNAVKRQARELFRQRCASLPPLDLVLRLAQPLGPAGKAASDRPAKAAWCAELAELFDRLQRQDRKPAR